MAAYMNSVQLLGHLGKDPEMRATANGKPVASASLAINRGERTDWFNIVAFERTAEILGEYFKKGDLALVQGHLQTNSWDDKRSGEKRSRTEIVAHSVGMFPKPAGATSAAAPHDTSDASVSDQGEDLDDDLPF